MCFVGGPPKISVLATYDSKSLLYRSCMYVDGNGDTHEIDQEDMNASKADPLGRTFLKLVFKDSHSIKKIELYHANHMRNILMSSSFVR